MKHISIEASLLKELNKLMKIAIISGRFQPKFGGMSGHAYQVARHFSRKGAQVRIYARRGECSQLTEENITSIPLLTHRFPILDAFLLRLIMIRFQPDWIHITEAGLAYRCLTKRFPSLVRVVGNDFLRPWSGFNLPLRFFLYRIPSFKLRQKIKSFEIFLRRKIVINRLKKVPIITNSEWTFKKLVDNGIPKKNIHILTGGIDTKIFKPYTKKSTLRKELNLDENKLVFITVANLIERKGHDVVIMALSHLVEKYEHFYYVIVGDGEYRPVLEKLVNENSIAEYVRFTEKINQQEVARYYQASDIYIQISRDVEIIPGITDNAETMGRTFIEAGACALPVIASNIGGIPSVVRDGYNGILVQNPRNIKEITDKMMLLANNKDLRVQLGTNGVERSKTEFSWDIICRKIEDKLKLMIAK